MNRKKRIDDFAFSQINEFSAYWSGFLLADGHMNPKTKQIFLQLARKDKDHIYKLRKFLRSNYKIGRHNGIRRGTKTFGVRIVFYSPIIYGTFIRYGFKSNKLDKRLCDSRHFWRGIVDGDGHLGITNGKPRFTLVGRKNIIASFLKFAKKNLPTLEADISNHGSIYAAQSTGRPAQAIMKLLYHNSKIHLDRKKDLAEKIIPLLLPDRTMKPRRKHIDETAFNRITNESAYWIGYIFYGSYIGPRSEGQTPVEIHVGLKKQHHLEGLRDFLNSNHSIQIDDASARFSFRSDAIASALAGHGIVPGRKNRQIPTKLKFNENFCRGIADGKNKRIRKNMAGS